MEKLCLMVCLLGLIFAGGTAATTDCNSPFVTDPHPLDGATHAKIRLALRWRARDVRRLARGVFRHRAECS